MSPLLSANGFIKIPPFRDAHIHWMRDGRPVDLGKLAGIKDALTGCGIFSVNDMGHRSGSGLAAKGLFGGALHVRSSGYALCRKGSYGAFLGGAVEGVEEIRKAVREIADAGADFIKVVNSGIACTSGAERVTAGGFSAEELKVIVGEAEERELAVVCHANSDEAIRRAVIAGASSIEHGFFVSDGTLRAMAERSVSWTPTAIALLSLSPFLSPAEKLRVEEITEGHLASIGYAASIGVKLNIGTDGGSKGVRHGEAFLDEARLFLEAGLSPEQVIAAACMGAEEIEKGNYLLVEEDFISTKRVAGIFRNGKRV